MTNVLQTQPQTHFDHYPQSQASPLGRGGGCLGCCGEACRPTAMNNLTGSWRRAVRSSNEARCHNEDGTVNLTLHLTLCRWNTHTYTLKKKKKHKTCSVRPSLRLPRFLFKPAPVMRTHTCGTMMQMGTLTAHSYGSAVLTA